MKKWIKLYSEINHDPKVGMLSDRLFRRFINCLAFAGELDKDGQLPLLEHMAWGLHCQPEQLEAELTDLMQYGLLSHIDGRWQVANFTKRQAREYGYSQEPAAIRQRKHRAKVSPQTPLQEKEIEEEKKKNKNRDVTNMSHDVSRDMSQKEDTDTYRTVTSVTKRYRNVTERPQLPIYLMTEDMATAWGEWLDYHEERGQPLTRATATAQFRQFKEWNEGRSIAAIRHSITNGYTGLIEPRSNNGRATPLEDSLAAVRDFVGGKHG